jgi:hypothetical protein
VIQIRQAENDLTTVTLLIFLMHTSGLPAAGMPFMHESKWSSSSFSGEAKAKERTGDFA